MKIHTCSKCGASAEADTYYESYKSGLITVECSNCENKATGKNLKQAWKNWNKLNNKKRS